MLLIVHIVSRSSEEFTAPTKEYGNNYVLAQLIGQGGESKMSRWQRHTSLVFQFPSQLSIACSATFLPLILSNCRQQTEASLSMSQLAWL